MVCFIAGFDTLASLLSQSDMPLFRAEEAKVCWCLFCIEHEDLHRPQSVVWELILFRHFEPVGVKPD